MMKRILALIFVLLSVSARADEIRDFSTRPDLAPEQVVSGMEFLTPESRSLQKDEFANPGLLWVDRGQALFTNSESAPACQSCHQTDGEHDLVSSATRFPRFDSNVGKMLNLEQRINACRVENQNLEPFAYESDELLALTTYLTYQAKGKLFEVAIDGRATEAFKQGRAYFFARKGQLNLACNQCHDDNWGKYLRGDRMSQGHPNAFPAYRIEWQTLGSLHRRLQDCDQGIRAEVLPKGSDTYVALELYLKWRAANLEIETPGIRR